MSREFYKNLTFYDSNVTQDVTQGGIQGIPYPISSFTSTTTSPLRAMTFLMRS